MKPVNQNRLVVDFFLIFVFQSVVLQHLFGDGGNRFVRIQFGIRRDDHFVTAAVGNRGVHADEPEDERPRDDHDERQRHPDLRTFHDLIH